MAAVWYTRYAHAGSINSPALCSSSSNTRPDRTDSSRLLHLPTLGIERSSTAVFFVRGFLEYRVGTRSTPDTLQHPMYLRKKIHTQTDTNRHLKSSVIRIEKLVKQKKNSYFAILDMITSIALYDTLGWYHTTPPPASARFIYIYMYVCIYYISFVFVEKPSVLIVCDCLFASLGWCFDISILILISTALFADKYCIIYTSWDWHTLLPLLPACACMCKNNVLRFFFTPA